MPGVGWHGMMPPMGAAHGVAHVLERAHVHERHDEAVSQVAQVLFVLGLVSYRQ